jgi:hypothetical protein
MKISLIGSFSTLSVRLDGKPFVEGPIGHPDFLGLPQWSGIDKIREGFLKLFQDRWLKPGRGEKPDNKNSDQRNTPRFSIHPKVLAYPLRPHVSRQPFGGGVKNLSKNGVCIETPEPLSDYQLFLLDFQFPGKGHIQTPARIVWSKNKVSGLEFLDPTVIDEILESTQKD